VSRLPRTLSAAAARETRADRVEKILGGGLQRHDRRLCLVPLLGRPADLDLRPAPARTLRTTHLTEDLTML
jgi:hypothetical protein